MKKNYLKMITGVLITLNIISCSKTGNVTEEIVNPIVMEFSNYEKSELKKLKEYRSKLFELIDWSKLQRNEDILTIPVIKNNKIISRVVIVQNTSYLIDYMNWKTEVKLFKFNEYIPFIKYDMIFNKNNQLYEPQIPNELLGKSQNLYACIAACTIAAVYMGLADGPLPFADVAALVYLALCIGECDANHG